MNKRVISIFLALALLVTSFAVYPKEAKAENNNLTYTLGTEAKGTIEKTIVLYMSSYSTDSYVFNVDKDMDLVVEFTSNGGTLEWTLDGPDLYKYTSVPSGTKGTIKYYAKPGAYTFKVTGRSNFSDTNTATYSFKLSDSNDYRVVFASPTGKVDGGLKKEIGFTYSCSYDYAKEKFAIKNSKSKVADIDYTLESDGTGKVIIDPKKIGKTVISASILGGPTATYTATVTKMFVFVQVGGTKKLAKPLGIKKPKFKCKKKSNVQVLKGGKIRGKKGGRATVTVKKGKSKFSYQVVVTDYIQLGKRVYREIKENVRNPENFKIYTVYKGFDKNIIKGVKMPVVFVDYGYPNSNGALERGKLIAYYDDVHEPKYIYVDSYADVMKRKKIPVSKIKH